MVTAQNEEILRVLDFIGEQQADGLQGLLSSVDVVTQEQVVGAGGNPPYSNRRRRSKY